MSFLDFCEMTGDKATANYEAWAPVQRSQVLQLFASPRLVLTEALTQNKKVRKDGNKKISKDTFIKGRPSYELLGI